MSFGLNEYRSPHNVGFGYALNGTAEGIRTPDLLIRSQTLYPTELQPHVIERTVFVLLADGLIILAQVGTECKRKIKISPKIFFGRERIGSSGALSLCNNALQAGHQIRHGLQLDIHLQNVLPELGWHGVKLCTDSGIDIGHGNHLADSMDRGTEIHTMKGNKNALRNRSAGVFGLSPTERRLPPCGGTVVLGV